MQKQVGDSEVRAGGKRKEECACGGNCTCGKNVKDSQMDMEMDEMRGCCGGQCACGN